jgi:hypothetical protein
MNEYSIAGITAYSQSQALVPSGIYRSGTTVKVFIYNMGEGSRTGTITLVVLYKRN